MLGRDKYCILYQSNLDKVAEWLRMGAIEKVNSIQNLLERNAMHPENIIELGCGTGAVIEECQRRNIGREYTAVDYSPEALGYIRNHSAGITLLQNDITAFDFKLDKLYDLAILSHVLEHLEEPASFLYSISRAVKFPYIIIEVPLEDYIYSRFVRLFRDRKSNRSGHVSLFNLNTFEQTLSSSGYTIIDKIMYIPHISLKEINFLAGKNSLSFISRILTIVNSYYMPKILRSMYAKIYYAHYAVLCVPPRL